MVESAGDEYNDVELVFNQTEGTTTASNSNHENDSGGFKEENKSASSLSSLMGREDSMELVDGVSLLQRLNLSTSGRVAGRWPKHVLARVTSFLSPVDIIECRIMCTSKRWRAIISEILPSLWQLHKEKLSPVRVQLELVDHDYLNRNRGLLLAMERWVQEIERSEESVIQGFFSEFSAKDQFW